MHGLRSLAAMALLALAAPAFGQFPTKPITLICPWPPGGTTDVHLRKFAEILVAMVEEIHKATGMVWDLSNEKKIQDAIVRISVLENEADALYFSVIADLFRGGDGKTPIEILKWKEVYQGLEDACDECKEFTHVLGNVVIKNA